MLAIRTNLLLDVTDQDGCEAAPSSAADAVTIDLSALPAALRRSGRRRAAGYVAAVAAAGRGAHVRVSDTRSGEMDGDLAAAVSEPLAAVLLNGAETPQDVRDADVGIRRHEMRLDIVPGSVRLIPLIDSAAGLLALPAILSAVDRHAAVALDADGVRVDLGLRDEAALAHAMFEVAIASSAAGLPWTVLAGGSASGSTPGERAALAASARDFGAAGVYVAAEAEARGLTALFTPPAEEIAEARETVATAATGGEPVDRRALRHARALVARAEAIERRERAR